MREVIKLGAVLFFVCALSGFGISYVNDFTKPIVIENQKNVQKEALKQVFPDADEYKDESEKFMDQENGLIQQVNIAYRDGKDVGVIYLVAPYGYSSNIKTFVGFDKEKKVITSINVLEQQETPGLGAQCEEPWFAERFKGKDAKIALEVVKSQPKADNQVEAISASTISSRAVTNGVNAAREHFINNF